MRACTLAHTHARTLLHAHVCDWLAQWHWYNSSEGVRSLNRRFEGRVRQAKNSDQLQENCSGWCSSTDTQFSEVKKKKKCNFFFLPLPMSLYRTWQCLEGQLFCLGRDGSLSIYCLFTYIILYKTIKDGKISYVYWNNKKHKFMSKELNFEKLQQIPRFPQQKHLDLAAFLHCLSKI